MAKQPTPFDPNTADADSVRLWMQASLDGYFEHNMGRWAFRPLEHYVGVRDDLAEDLRAIYRDVEPHAQAHWRAATRDLLAMQGRDLSKRDATRALIDFAGLIRAHEVLDVLPALVSSDPEALLDPIVETAVALASPTKGARTCLQRLHTSPSFSADYAGLVLVALCHVDPDGWLRHVENLAPAMNVLASRLEDDSTALRYFAGRILEAISLTRLDYASLNQLTRSSASAWLWHQWLGSPNSLLRYEAEPQAGPRLALRANNAQSIGLKEPLAALAVGSIEDEVRDDTVTAVLIANDDSEVWVAAFEQRRITHLASQRSYTDAVAWLQAFVVSFPDIRNATSLKYDAELTRSQSSAGVAFQLSHQARQPWFGAIDPATMLDNPTLSDTKTRIDLLKPYRQRISPTDRRAAMHSRPASEALGCAIRLAETHTMGVPAQLLG